MADVPVNANDAVFVADVTVNGQTAFDYDFRIDDEDDMRVDYILVSTGARTPVALGTGFSVDGIGQANGGTVTFLAGAPVTVAGNKVAMYRETVIDRLADYQKAGDFRAETVNAEFDKQTMTMQELRRDIDGAIRVQPGETAPSVSELLTLIEETEDNAEAAAASAAAAAASAATIPALGAAFTVVRTNAAGTARENFDLSTAVEVTDNGQTAGNLGTPFKAGDYTLTGSWSDTPLSVNSVVAYAAWVGTNMTLSGAGDVKTLLPTVTNGEHAIDVVTTPLAITGAETFRAQAVAKQNGYKNLRFRFAKDGVFYANIIFDLNAGTFTADAGVSNVRMVDMGSGYYLCCGDVVNVAGSYEVKYNVYDNAGAGVFAGDGVSSILSLESGMRQEVLVALTGQMDVKRRKFPAGAGSVVRIWNGTTGASFERISTGSPVTWSAWNSVASFEYSSDAIFAASNVPSNITRVVVGDGRSKHWKKRISTPSVVEAWHTQTKDGAWWEISEDTLTPFMLGATGAANVNDGPALNNTMAAAKAIGAKVDLPVYFWSSEKVTIPAGAKVSGRGMGAYRPSTTAIDLNGSGIVIFGTVAKTETLDFVSRMDKAGGRVLNPAFGQAGISAQLSQYYELLDFTNLNASGTTRATLKAFSVGVHVEEGGGTVLADFRIMLANGADGISEFLNTSSVALGADCDVGIWVENHSHIRMSNVAVVGYWRMAGRLVSSVPTGSDAPSCEYGLYEGCIFQGYKGSAFRSNDLYAIISLTGTSVTIPWSASHRWPSSGSFRSGSIGTFSYSAIAFTGGNLVLSGISSTAGLSVGDGLRPLGATTSGNFGFSGTTHKRCYITGLSHNSRLLAKTLGFAGASSYCEMSGDSMRAIEFDHCTFLGHDEVAIHMHDVLEPTFSYCYGEGQTARTTAGGAFDISAGARIIASPLPSANTRATNPVGSTGNLHDFGSTWNESLDFTPDFPSTNVPRFGAYGGLYEPQYQNNLGKAFSGVTGGMEWVFPVGEILTLGPSSGNTTIEAKSGELDLRATAGNLVRMRVGSTTVASVSENILALLSQRIGLGTASDDVAIVSGSGSPEGVVSAPPNSIYLNKTAAGVATWMYRKNTGTGNTGWVAASN